MMVSDIEIYKRGIQENKDTATTIAMEECAELTKAISKAKRGKMDRGNLIEEIADVLVCINWVKDIYNIDMKEIEDMVEYKNNRCLNRLKNGKFK